MKIYTITKNGKPTNYTTTNPMAVVVGLVYLNETQPNDVWDYITRDIEE